MSRQVPGRAMLSCRAFCRYCACTSALSRGSLLSTGLRPRLTCTPSNPRLLAMLTASSLPVCCRFNSVTTMRSPPGRVAAAAVHSAAPARNNRREMLMLSLHSILVRNKPVLIIRLRVSMRFLPLGKLHFLRGNLLVWDHAKQMRDAVQPRAPFVVALHHVPGSELTIGCRKRGDSVLRVVVPASLRFQVHWTQLPPLSRIGDPLVETPCLLLLTYL